jgi:hypothetical protein
MTSEADSGTKHGAEAAPKSGVKKQNKIVTQHEGGHQTESDAKYGLNVEPTQKRSLKPHPERNHQTHAKRNLESNQMSHLK